MTATNGIPHLNRADHPWTLETAGDTDWQFDSAWSNLPLMLRRYEFIKWSPALVKGVDGRVRFELPKELRELRSACRERETA